MDATLTFDRELPRLPVLADAVAVASLLAPGGDVARVRRLDTKYVPGVRCVAAYELRMRSPSTSSVLGAVVVTPDGVVAHPVDRDPALPRLRHALDAVSMRRRFAGARACRVTPVRYKPGVRCVLRYDVTTSSGTQTHYGKLLRDGAGDEARIIRALRRLADSAGAFTVPPLSAHWADLGMLLQPSVGDSSELHDLATDTRVPREQRRAVLERGGRALAALHGIRLPGLASRLFLDDVAEVRDFVGIVERADPSCARQLDDLVERLALADDATGSEWTTTHGAFRTDQLLVAGQEMVLIDLDGVCRAEPARDIANLLAYLDWKVIRKPQLASIVADISNSFLSGYAEIRPLPSPSRLSRYRAASLAKIAGRRFRSLSMGEWPLVPELLSRAARALSSQEVVA